MNRNAQLRTLLSWIALLAFGIGQGLSPGTWVVCTDGHGQTKIEPGCFRAPTGECVTGCATAGETRNTDYQSVPHPCQDTPLTGDALTASYTTRLVTHTAFFSLPAAAASAPMSFAPSVAVRYFADPCLDRPPDILAQLHTIVILV